MFIKVAIALGTLVTRNDADGVVFITTVDVLHVGSQLGDIHPAVTIKGEISRLLDAITLAEHEL